MTRLDALFVPNNILNCHIPDRSHLSNCHIPDKIEIQTAIFRMVTKPTLHLDRLSGSRHASRCEDDEEGEVGEDKGRNTPNIGYLIFLRFYTGG